MDTNAIEVVAVVSRLLADTRGFLETVASHPAVRMRLLKGDAGARQALPVLRGADRIWFEGTGRCLGELAAGPAASWLPWAQLHLGADETSRLLTPGAAADRPGPGLWRLVRDAVVPTPEDARRLKAIVPPQVTVRAAPTPDRLLAAFSCPGLPRNRWKAVNDLAEACRGRVRLRGDPPRELRPYLEVAYGLPIADEGPADTTVVWDEDLAAGHAACRIEQDPAVRARPPAFPVRSGGPLVSAVVPVYNGADTIERCLRSLRRQTWANLEILVIDDGSTDGTARLVAQHLNDPRVHYFYKPHSGRPESRNLGVEKSRGRYLAWLDADDVATPNRIRAEVEAALADGADVVFADGLTVQPDGETAGSSRYRSLSAEDLPARLLAGIGGLCPILNTSTLVRRDLYDRAGLYDREFLRCQDYEFWCRAAAVPGVRFRHVPVPLVHVYKSAVRPEALPERGRYCARLVAGLVERFGPDRLVDPVARDLHESGYACVARHVGRAAALYRVPPDHELSVQARHYAALACQAAEALEGGTGFQPVDHGQDAHATSRGI